ncbi:MAG: thioredoxin [Dokdonella sp.]|uniref:thioredoxin n=1 Tax=Dokdonella sp. TaxID=2291710 RepID=UPI0025C44D24|nr:thioredoxin [Dokdonella sp.]MBX3699431.1 thioredoxin [Dokdonella sp.]
MSANPPSPYVFDATEANFQGEVIDASFEQPILVDLWATWCGPCKTLGPILEKVVDAFNGAVRLAKIDVDKEQALAAAFGVRSIPTVVLIRDGQAVDGFNGALPEGGVREFLQRHVQPAPAPAEASEPPVREETPAQAIARIEQEIAAEPDKAELRLDLAVAQMQAGNAAAAEAELDALPANLASDDRARRLRGRLDFAHSLKDAPAIGELRARIERNGADYEAHDLLGVRLLVDGQVAAGLEQFLGVLKADRNWNEGQARKRLVAAFSVVDDEELVGSYRRKMSSLLF